MILYLIKSILCSAIFLMAYLLLLEKEKMHRFNRWYLLGSIVCSFIVPLISFTTELQSLPVLEEIQFRYIDFMNTGNNKISPSSTVHQATDINWKNVLLTIHCGMSIVLLMRFSKNIYLLVSRITKNKVIIYGEAKLVLLKEEVVSHTFLNHIFISETDYTDQKVEEEILIHELTHVQQKHSLDILFIEFLQAVFWFNPLFIFYKKSIQLNHEFLADEAVLKKYTNVPAYQSLLLEKISLGNKNFLASPFNFSVTKKRLVMMTRKTNQFRMLVKELFVIPLLAVIVLIFSNKSSAQKLPVFTQTGKEVASTKEGVSQKVLDEFNTIIEKNETKNKNGHIMLVNITDTERNRLETIYFQMSKAQQLDSKVVFEKRILHKLSGEPSKALFESFKDPAKFGVWINGKKVTNDVLNKYKPSDFGDYWSSNLYYTEKMKKDVMKTFNLTSMYEKQLELTTKEIAEEKLKSDLALVKKHPYTMFFRYDKRAMGYIN